MSSGFDDYALPFVWRADNDGQGYHVTDGDPGGATNRGVTVKTWNAAIDRGVVLLDYDKVLNVYTRPLLQNATLAQLSAVLRVDFWNAIHGSQILRGVDLVLFNIAMASGPGTAGHIVQRLMGFAPPDAPDDDPLVLAGKQQDGAIGPVTLRSLNSYGASKMINDLTDADETFYAGLPTFRLFGNGWDRRAEDCRTLALSLVGP